MGQRRVGEPVRAEWRRRLRQMTGYYILPDDVPPDLKLGRRCEFSPRPTSVFAPTWRRPIKLDDFTRVESLHAQPRAARIAGNF